MPPLDDTALGLLLQRPCQCCGQLAGQETCQSCEHHYEAFGLSPQRYAGSRYQASPGFLPVFVARVEENYFPLGKQSCY
jgi:hypothetical protein